MVTSEDNGSDWRHPELWDTPGRIRKELACTMAHIYSHGMTTTSGGNMSVIDGLGNIWITPSGTDKGSMKPDDVVCLYPDGTVEGLYRPSMEHPMHSEVYRARPDIRAIIHAHPPLLTSFSISHRVPDTSVVRGWQELCGTTGYAGYATPGSSGVTENVAEEFRKGHNAVIMENHAVVVGGGDLAEALARLETLENCAITIHAAGFVGDVVVPPVPENSSGSPATGNSSGPPATGNRSGPPADGSSRSGNPSATVSPGEDSLAEEICMIAARACSRGLIYGFCGTVSARSTGNRFLMTPDGTAGWVLKKEDIIRVGGSDTGGGIDNLPGSWLHDEIYKRFPSAGSVIVAQPPYLMAFAVRHKEIDVRTIPESWLLLREMPSVPFGAAIPGREELFEKLSEGYRAVIIFNEGIVVTGDNLLQAFDRLEVAEMTAMSLILARSLGRIHPIDGEKINDLDKKFQYKY